MTEIKTTKIVEETSPKFNQSSSATEDVVVDIGIASRLHPLHVDSRHSSREHSNSNSNTDVTKHQNNSVTERRHYQTKNSLTSRKNEVLMTSNSSLTVLTSSSIKSPVPENCIRVVCISDTHSQVENIDFASRVPDGDVLLHAGDFTFHGEIDEFEDFSSFLDKLPHRIKLATPGNHEVSLDPRGLTYNIPAYRTALGLPACEDAPTMENYKDVVDKLLELVPNAIVLTDAWLSVCGIKIYGFPWVPAHGAPGFGFKHKRDMLAKLSLIPDDTDILISHGPAHGFGDFTHRGRHVGCQHLETCVRERIQPKLVVSGHIHEGYGVYTDGLTTFLNASTCNRGYRPKQNPIVVDYCLPEPFTRDDFLNLRQDQLTVNINGRETSS